MDCTKCSIKATHKHLAAWCPVCETEQEAILLPVDNGSAKELRLEIHTWKDHYGDIAPCMGYGNLLHPTVAHRIRQDIGALRTVGRIRT